MTDGSTLSILKKLRRRMQMRGVKLMQDERKRMKNKKTNHPNTTVFVRVATWELACLMIDTEIEALERSQQ